MKQANCCVLRAAVTFIYYLRLCVELDSWGTFFSFFSILVFFFFLLGSPYHNLFFFFTWPTFRKELSFVGIAFLQLCRECSLVVNGLTYVSWELNEVFVFQDYYFGGMNIYLKMTTYILKKYICWDDRIVH